MPPHRTEGHLRLLSIVGHELRTPLTVIRGAATLVLQAHDQLPPERLAEMLRLIDDNSETMAERIEDMLSVGHLDAGDLQLRLHDVPARDIVVPALESARRVGQGRVEVEGDYEDASVHADLERAVQALRSLLGLVTRESGRNALVTLGIETLDRELRFEIVDPLREHVEPISRLLKGVKNSGELDSGLALSLYLARGLAEAMGGRFGSEREADGRSKLWFTLRRDD